jgi:carbon storage regulator
MSLGRSKPTKYKLLLSTNSRKNQMLVLTRKASETVVIGGDVTIQVVKVQGNRITLGIEAPSKTKILRGELQKPVPTMARINVVVQDGQLVAC